MNHTPFDIMVATRSEKIAAVSVEWNSDGTQASLIQLVFILLPVF